MAFLIMGMNYFVNIGLTLKNKTRYYIIPTIRGCIGEHRTEFHIYQTIWIYRSRIFCINLSITKYRTYNSNCKQVHAD